MSPENPTTEELKALDRITDAQIEDWVESQRIREVPKITEGLGIDDSE